MRQLSPTFAVRIRQLVLAGFVLGASGMMVQAGNLGRGSTLSSSASASSSTSQTSTAATNATSQTSQSAVIAERAQVSLQRSLMSLQAIQAQAAAQSAARNLSFSSGANNLGTVSQPLPNVPDGLAVNGLVPGVADVDPANPATVAIPVPVTANAGGTASVTLTTGTSLTLPPTASSPTQITVSGSGTVGSVTTGGTITPLVAGVSTSVPAGSTISLTNGGTITFAAGSSIPASVSTYAYTTPTTPAATVPVPSSWSGVSGLSQATYAAGAGQSSPATTVTVDQTSQQALLTWQSFNIGKNTTLDFDQSLGGANVADWVAINKVAANIAPSQVLGAIQAPGQVYVINQNGIIFGGSSQVNVGALVASSLPIDYNLVARGLLNNPDLQFLFSQLDEPAGTQGPTNAFTPQGTSSSPGSAPAPGSYGANGGLIAQVDSSGNLSLASPNGQDGDIVVQAGAQLSSPTTPEHVGGRVALIGPNVNNAGTISTPDGQTILAAGLQVGMEAHPSTDPSLRGLDVAVGSVSDPTYDNGAAGIAGTASNTGTIEMPRADLTMIGQNVFQEGVVDSSTSISLNGRVDLLADYDALSQINGVDGFQGTTNFYPTASGNVIFGANSLTQILPELSSSETIVGTQLALSSLVNVEAGAIDMQSGAMLLAPSATLPSDASQPALGIDGVALTAGVTFDAGQWLPQSDSAYGLSFTSGQVYLDANSVIDVSGSENVSESVADNIISAQLLGTELADSPLQQNGALRGATVYVDIRNTGSYDGTEWVGSPIGDLSGYVNLIQHTVGQLTTAGGTVAINAGGSTVLQPSATVDVSGGWINYQGGMVQTTEVVSNGLVYDISQATPDRVYEGIYTGFDATSAKWGVSQSYSETLQSGAEYEAGYIQGGNGGSISISSPAMALDGSFLGSTVAGSNQRTPAAQITSTYGSTTYLPTMLDIFAVPSSSSLSLTFQAQDPTSSALAEISPTPPEILFTDANTLPAVGSFGSALPTARVDEVDLSPDLVNSDGFGSLAVSDGDGNVIVPADVSLNIAPLGSLTITAANIDIGGDIGAPGGALTFTALDFSPYGDPTAVPPADFTRGKIVLESSATLSVAGLIVDDRSTTPGAGTEPLVTNGGKISLNAFSIDLESGASARDAIDVSGGIDVTPVKAITYGNGGSITVEAGQDPLLSAIVGGNLTWDPSMVELTGYSGAKGGSLTVKAPLVQIGGDALVNGDTVTSGNTLWLDATDTGGNLLQPEFFSQGGFTSYTIDGIGEAVLANGSPTGAYLPATLIAPSTTIAPVVSSWVATLNNDGTSLTSTLLLPGLRVPVSLAFNDAGAKDNFFGVLLVRGYFVMDEGSSILTDPQTTASGGVSINANTVALLGTIDAPGGTISITGGSNSSFLFSSAEALPTVDLGPDSELSTAGVVNWVPNVLGYQSGSVLNGGTIDISGNIVAENGAVIDVSGATGTLDVAPTQAGITLSGITSLTRPIATEVDSNGGTIILDGAQELFSDATLLGAAGGPSAQGGSLNVSSGIFLNGVQTPLDPTLIVTQDSATIPVADFYPLGQTAIGNPVVDGSDNILDQRGYFAADHFNNSGMSSLTLGGVVQFSGPVTLTANQSLTVGQGGVIFADGQVNLTAPYVDLGMAFQSPEPSVDLISVFQAGGAGFYFNPVYGSGNLNVTASLIDVGNLSLQDIGQLELNAPNGDIRGDGTLDVSGTVSLTAGQIYPTTETSFTIADYDYNNTPGDCTIIIEASGSREFPLSAGGELNIYASNITQGGVLRAPIGTINLGSGVNGSAPIDYISGSGVSGSGATETIPTTQQLTLTSSSVTSVSAVDPLTGQALDLAYGTNTNGVSWTDPAGNDITVAGNGVDAIPAKTVNLSGVQIADQSGATINLSGGGDLYSYSFVTGTGGTQDILASNTSFAIIPGYQGIAAPYYSSTDYTNSQLSVGEQIYLNASPGLAAGIYTLMPARYALEPGAFLITPESSTPSAGSVPQADGSTIVSGYEFNGFNTGRTGTPLLSSFEVDSPSVVASRASYDVLSANTFLSQSATNRGLTTPRLPVDAGQLVIAATQSLSIDGVVDSRAGTGGLGGLVDIATPNAILIAGPNTDLSNMPGSTLVLQSSDLSAFGADSLLIGGYRQETNGGDAVTVTTDSITVDNAGASVDVDGQTLEGLSAPDVILVSNQNLTLAAGAEITQSGTDDGSAALTLFLTGDGTFLRVSNSAPASTVRTGTNPSDTSPSMSIGAGVELSANNGGPAGSVTLDSTYATSLDSSALLDADTVNLDSGQISIEVQPPASAPLNTGLVLSGEALANLQSNATTLSLLSYSSIDIYGSGVIGSAPSSGVYPVASLALHAAEIRGFSDSGGGGNVTINAGDITLDNSPGGQMPGPSTTVSGSLTINAATIDLGTNQMDLDQYANVTLNASSGIILDAETKVTQADTSVVDGMGALVVYNDLTLNAPFITSAAYSTTQAPGSETMTASHGDLDFETPGTPGITIAEGLGGKLTLEGQNVTVSSIIELPSGSATLHATAGNVVLGGSIDAAGTAVTLGDTVQYSAGGEVSLVSDTGAVQLTDGSLIDVSANSGGGNAGSVAVEASNGTFMFSSQSKLMASGGQSGAFSLDVGELQDPDLQTLDLGLTDFVQSISIRDRTDSEVTLDGSVKTGMYNLSVDSGSIVVNGTINASDVPTLDSNGNAILVGGTIDLSAADSITLASGSMLSVAAENFNNAGQGGSITLTSGLANAGFTNTSLNTLGNSNTSSGPLVAIESGATLDLSVAAETASSAAQGDVAGTLTIAAPQTSGNADLQIAPIDGDIMGASSIAVVGDQVFKATNGSIDGQKANVLSNGQLFAGNTTAILGRLYAGNTNATALAALTEVEPGAEIINPNGNLTLASTWDLSTYRFGPGVTAGVDGSGAPGVLTLLAAGNVIFNFGASLNDGFDPANTSFSLSSDPLWTAPLLPAGDQSWSYQIVAGNDFTGAAIGDVASLASLQNSGLGGSVIIGQGAPALSKTLTSSENKRAYVLVNEGYFQVIRTGTGNITMDAGGDVQLVNDLAAVYTAGTQAPDITGFTDPTILSTPQPPVYGAQYSLEGGNISVTARGNIAHYVGTNKTADSSKELPNDWLSRQGSVDANGDYVDSTSWWVDFSNFFEGFGALGGGNVTLNAGESVINVDAVAPTNARMPVTDADGNPLVPSASNLVELGGGNVTVEAGDDINGGIYYVERGQGTLEAGNQILTNTTRAAVRKTGNASVTSTWLPTTLFVGDGGFTIGAGGDVLLGPVANPFLLPQGVTNGYQNESYFSTYAASDSIDVSSLTGTVTLKDNSDDGSGTLTNWYTNVVMATGGSSAATGYEGWTESTETSITPFDTAVALMPSTLEATSYSGDVDVIGSLTLSPSPTGTIDLAAAGSLNGFQVNDNNNSKNTWGSSVINLSDANPAAIPSVTTPLTNGLATTDPNELNTLNVLFDETAATDLVLQTKEELHADIDGQVLHADDPNPIQLVAGSGDISGFTVYSGKAAEVLAGQDITDIALYIQNVNENDVTVVSAGRDVIAYDPESTLRLDAGQPGNAFLGQTTQNLTGTGLGGPNAGDIQISGPGTLEVLAGRNLDLGVGSENANGTGVGISSIGNTDDPFLSTFSGADVIAAAGMGVSGGFNNANAQVDFAAFEAEFLEPGSSSAALYLPQLGSLMGLPDGETDAQIWTAFNTLPAARQDALSLNIFYLVLRDAGRNHNEGTGSGYDSGYAAIAALFPGDPWAHTGDISLTSREIKTTNGGNIDLLAPGGSVTVGYDIAGNQPLDQGILTEDGGNINIFTEGDVNVGTSRIFTLHGGNEIIWSTDGNIAAGNSSKTVQSAPPTRVLIDPQSGSVQTDLAGLATGGGIGVLETVVGAPPSDVDLIAPNGTVDAGDAGIRVSGNLNIAAARVLNAGNISVGGKSAGVPTAPSVNIAGLSAASSASGAANNAASEVGNNQRNQLADQQDSPSIITVEVLGYGG